MSNHERLMQRLKRLEESGLLPEFEGLFETEGGTWGQRQKELPADLRKLYRRVQDYPFEQRLIYTKLGMALVEAVRLEKTTQHTKFDRALRTIDCLINTLKAAP